VARPVVEDRPVAVSKVIRHHWRITRLYTQHPLYGTIPGGMLGRSPYMRNMVGAAALSNFIRFRVLPSLGPLR